MISNNRLLRVDCVIRRGYIPGAYPILSKEDDMALKDKKLDPKARVDEDLAKMIRGRLEGGKLACAAAFDLADERGLPRLDIGRTADVLAVHLTRCQLGLFGYPDKKKFWETNAVRDSPLPTGPDEAILATRDRQNVISCASLMAIAERFGLSLIQVGFQADRLGVQVKGCQLGAF